LIELKKVYTIEISCNIDPSDLDLSGNLFLSEQDIITLKDKGIKSHVIIDPYPNRAVRLPVK
jgi:hypothetical protein